MQTGRLPSICLEYAFNCRLVFLKAGLVAAEGVVEELLGQVCLVDVAALLQVHEEHSRPPTQNRSLTPISDRLSDIEVPAPYAGPMYRLWARYRTVDVNTSAKYSLGCKSLIGKAR